MLTVNRAHRQRSAFELFIDGILCTSTDLLMILSWAPSTWKRSEIARKQKSVELSTPPGSILKEISQLNERFREYCMRVLGRYCVVTT